MPFAETQVGLRLAAPGGGGALLEATQVGLYKLNTHSLKGAAPAFNP